MRCEVCGLATSQTMVGGVVNKRILLTKIRRARAVPYCLDHLLEAYEARFLNFADDVVVFHPESASLPGRYVYGYLPLVESERTNGTEAALVSESLEAVGGRCARCGAVPSVAYYGPGALPRRRVIVRGEELDVAAFEDVAASPEVLCRSCAFAAIAPGLRSLERVVSLHAPYGGKGLICIFMI